MRELNSVEVSAVSGGSVFSDILNGVGSVFDSFFGQAALIARPVINAIPGIAWIVDNVFAMSERQTAVHLPAPISPIFKIK